MRFKDKLNEGKGKFEIEKDYADDGFDFVHTEITWRDNAGRHRGFDIVIYFAVTLERDNEINALGGENVYCTIEGYNWEAKDYADEVIRKIESLGGYTKIVNYMKSL